MRTTKVRSRLSLLFIALAAMIAIPAAMVFADTLKDNLTGPDKSVSLGTINPGETGSGSVGLTVECTGNSHGFGSVPFSVGKALNTDSAGSTSEVSVNPSVVLPATWPADGTGCGNPKPSQSGTAQISVSVPDDASPGARSIKITVQSTDNDVANVVNFSVNYDVPGSSNPADTTPPNPPTLNLVATSDSGHSQTDDITNDNTPTFDGTAEAGSTVEVFAGNTSLGTAQADAQGNWSHTVANSNALSDGVHSITATATDAAGNPSQPSSALSVTIDTQNPTVEVSGFENGDIFYKGDPNSALPTPGCSISDPTPSSGLYSQSSSPALKSGTGLNAEGVGSATYSCAAQDNAGNSNTDEESYSVQYARNGGILQPINSDNSSVFSRGRAVPVKFQLGNDQPNGFGTSTWELKRVQVSCGNLADELQTESVSSVTPSTVFRYDSSADQYIYNADFRDKTAGTCWYVSADLKDGSTPLKSAYFKLQK